jgi:ATP-binding protein involved in chromosome partitioning
VPDLEAVESAVGDAHEPLLRRSLGELGLIDSISEDGPVGVRVAVAMPSEHWPADDLGRVIADAAKTVAGVESVAVDATVMADDRVTSLAASLRESHARVGGEGSQTRVVSIASGKGGVGKSSVAANTAVALARAGHDVAVLDADVWGFSIPRMLGIETPPHAVADLLIPAAAHGVRAISMDFFVSPDQAVIWRGPMLHKALEQFLQDVFWDEPEFLLIDMPPGTGDVAISISQFLPRSQTLVVTTPQPTAQLVARRAALMAAKVNQEVMGVVENMSWFTGDDGKRYPIFGEGGGEALAEELGVPLFGKVPLLAAMRDGADRGRPVHVADAAGEAAEAFDEIAAKIRDRRPRVRTNPELVIS